MNATNKTALVISFVVVVVLFLLFGGGAMTGATLSGGMMKKEMVQMMMEMMNMQEKMMKGPKASEKKQMMKEMAQVKEKMQKMMSMHMDMTGMDDSQSKLKCAEQWLKKAIDLHELHMKDSTTTTDASQMERMDQIKKAYGCLTGTGPDMSGTQSKEVESKEPKKSRALQD